MRTSNAITTTKLLDKAMKNIVNNKLLSNSMINIITKKSFLLLLLINKTKRKTRDFNDMLKSNLYTKYNIFEVKVLANYSSSD